MKTSREQFVRDMMSGQARGVRPTLLRAATAMAEPFYALAMRVRNKLFDSGIKRQHSLGRPVVSVGNITTGGTGKTPMVQWLARKLLAAGRHPACVLRGYTVGDSTLSDEATLLRESLKIPVVANPDRIAAARTVLSEHPETDLILLDDAFQHRRVRRDLDIVLIDATNSFGYGHVLPRGMLREPLSGLQRADVIIITRADLISIEQLDSLEEKLRRFNARSPILRSRHAITLLTDGNESRGIESIRGQRVFSFCGIANPIAFQAAILLAGAVAAGHRSFADHHAYSKSDLDQVMQSANSGSAQIIVTTEKDWVKIKALLAQQSVAPILCARMEIEFAREADAETLLKRIIEIKVQPSSSNSGG